jgi:hypothetical protein
MAASPKTSCGKRLASCESQTGEFVLNIAQASSKFLLAQLLWLGLIASAIAWETETAVPLPAATGWLPDGVELVRARVDLAGSNITLRYLFRNSGKTARSNTFAIYLPAFAWQGVAANYPDRHFPELRVASGQHARTIALHDGRDITADLRRSGLAAERVGFGEEALVVADAADQRRYRKLLASGALHGADGIYLPRWYAQTTHAWRQSYPPGETEMSIRYQARPGFALVERNSSVLVSELRAHCATADDIEAILSRRLFPDSDYLLMKTYVIPFVPERLNIQQARLDFAPTADEATVSFVCTDRNSRAMVRGAPTIFGQEIDTQRDTISVLTISGP